MGAHPPYFPHPLLPLGLLLPPPPAPVLCCGVLCCAVVCCAAEEGRKAAFAVRGHKLALAAARHYVLAVLADGEGAAAGTSGQQVGAGMPALARRLMVRCSGTALPPRT